MGGLGDFFHFQSLSSRLLLLYPYNTLIPCRVHVPPGRRVPCCRGFVKTLHFTKGGRSKILYELCHAGAASPDTHRLTTANQVYVQAHLN